MKKTALRFFALFIAAAITFAVPASAMPQSGEEQLELLHEIASYIDEYALYPSGDTSLAGVTAKRLDSDPDLFMSIVESWQKDDKYGHFMTAEEYAEAFNLTGAAYGIGVQVDITMPTGIYVEAFLPGGGAESSGMEIGAQIVSVDGADVADTPYMEARWRLLGEPFTSVTVGYINPGSAEILYDEIERGPLNVSDVQCEIIEGTDIGYISVSQFGSLADFFDYDYYYNEYLPAAGARSVIIDLRGNPGGQLDTALNMLNTMLEEEGLLLCRLVANDEAFNETYYSTGWGDWGYEIWQPDNIVILVDANSASASEVFAGTLQEHKLATVVGETTYGKSHSQYHLEMTTGDILVITSSRVELLNIGTYEDVGIIPEYIVEPGITTGAELGLFPLESNRALFRHSLRTERITAMQERLALLGFYRAEPDGVFDDYTLWCLNRFQASLEMRLTSYANAATLKALEDAANELELYENLQLEKAVELCTPR